MKGESTREEKSNEKGTKDKWKRYGKKQMRDMKEIKDGKRNIFL